MVEEPFLATRPGNGPDSSWQAHAGKDVRLHVHPEALSPQRAQALLREADLIASTLKRLLAPGSERASCPVDICLADPEALPSLAQSLTRLLITRWFGPDAGCASIIVAGIAGLAAAQTGTSLSVEEADRWVRQETEAKRLPSLAALNATVEPDMAATSFVAFLVASFGERRLRDYLAAFDPARVDRAAEQAYKQPLAVLEETWRKGLHRGESKDAMRSLLPQLLKEIRPYRTRQAEILLCLILAACLSVVPALLAGRIVGVLKAASVSGAAGVPAAFPFLLLAFSGSLMLSLLVSLRRSYSTAWLSQHLLIGLQERMYAHLLNLSHDFYCEARIGDLMERLTGDLQTVQQALTQWTNKGLYQLFKLAASSIALVAVAYRAPQLTLPLLLLVPIFYGAYACPRTRNKQAGREQRRRVAETASVVQESLAAQEVIKAFGIQDRSREVYHARAMTQKKSAIRLALLNALSDLSEDTINGIAMLVVYGMGGLLLLRVHTVDLGTIVTLAALLSNLFGPVASLAGIGQNLQQAVGSMERVHELFEMPVSITDASGAKSLTPPLHSIELENISFRYDGKREILQNLSLSIPAGTNVALVGRSGGGKSTVARLLMRFWDPTVGRVLFDGQDLREVSVASLRKQIGPVFQDTFIFNTTVMENIRLSRPDATDAEVIEAARQARLEQDVAQFPAGFNTVLGERGGRMSGGQRQRLAIARAFLRNPSVLILDEATSSLDPETEAGIVETLSLLAKGRTTISIAHRLSWAMKADLVFVLDAGRLVEQGTHAELLAADGLYSQLWNEYIR